MKKKILLMALCGALVLSSGFAALAAPWGRGGCQMDGSWRGNGPGRVEADQGRWQRMFAKLDLSAEQQAEMQKLCDANRGQAEQLRARMVEVRRQLRQAMAPNNFDEKALRKVAAEKHLLQTELMVNRARTHSQIYALLTPEQQELADLARKMKQLQGPNPRAGRGGMGGKGGRGGLGMGRPDCPQRVN